MLAALCLNFAKEVDGFLDVRRAPGAHPELIVTQRHQFPSKEIPSRWAGRWRADQSLSWSLAGCDAIRRPFLGLSFACSPPGRHVFVAAPSFAHAAIAITYVR